MKFLMTSAAIAAMAFVPATANAQLFGGFDNGTLLSGAVGAGLGGAIGSNLAGSGVRDEGTAIGAVVGGLAGAAYANSRSNYGGNPYAGSFNPGFNGRNLVGSGIGAGLGGVIGSNLAGSGQRQEGTAIGALLGGAAGYALSNRGNSRYGGYGPQGGYGGGYAPAPMGGFNRGHYGAPHMIGGGLPMPARHMGPNLVHSGQYISGPIMPVTTYRQPAPQPVRVMTRPATWVPAPITYAAPNVRLSGPPIRPTVVRHTHRTEYMPIARAERVVVPASTYSMPALSSWSGSSSHSTTSSYSAPAAQMADCPAGTTKQSDGTCMERSVSYTAPVVSQPYRAPQTANCPAGTTKQSDGTCLETSYSSSAFGSVTLPETMLGGMSYGSTSSYGSSSSYSSSSSMVACPAGTTKQSDGTCLSSSTTSYTPSYSSSSATTTYRAPSTAHSGHSSYSTSGTVATPSTDGYCYSNSSKRYDSLGNEIKSHHKSGCKH